MRHMKMVTLLACIFLSSMQCGEKESLNSLIGGTTVKSAGIEKSYVIGPDTLFLRTDSIAWVYMFPTIGSSGLSIILSGTSQTDVTVETYMDGAQGPVTLARDSMGVFIDTVPIASSDLSGLVLTQSSRLFVKSGDQTLDTLRLVNPQEESSIPPPKISSAPPPIRKSKVEGSSIIGK